MKNLKYLFIATLSLFCFSACEDVPEPYTIPGMQGGAGGSQEGIIYEENFASSLGSFTQSTNEQNVNWIIDYNSACISGYDKESSTRHAAENYLISPAIDLTGKDAVYLSVNYAIGYMVTNVANECHKIFVSSDYAGDVSKATWTELAFTPQGNTSGSFVFVEDNIDLPASVLGKSKVHVAFRYKSTTTEASTWEIKSMSVNEGTAPEKEEVEAKEITVAQAIASNSGLAIVKGYIVGFIDGKSIDGAQFSSAATVETNIIIADNPDESDISKCLPVQLPSGDVRNKVNLKSNPGNYKKLVFLTGNLEKYFGAAGLKSVTKAMFEGEEEGEGNTGEGDKEEPTGKIYLNETFANDLGSFTTAQIVDDYAWKHEVYQNKAYAKVSGYANNASQEAESWLISPSIDLSNETSAVITFDYVINKGEASLAATNHQLMITDNYTGDFFITEWKAIDFGATNDNTWNFRSAKATIPAEMMGKSNVVIAFKYTSTTSASSTWELNNVVVAGSEGGEGGNTGNEGEGGNDDNEGDTPSQEEEVLTVAQLIAAYNNGTTGATKVTGYIVGTSEVNKPAYTPIFGTDKASNTNILLADSPNETDGNKCIPVQLPQGSIRSDLNIQAHPENIGKKVTLTGEILKYYKMAGLKNTSAYVFE